MPDLAEAIRVHMQNGAEPITFEEISAIDLDGLEVPRIRPGRRSPSALVTSPSAREPRSLRVPAIAWAGLLALVLVAAVVGVTVSASHSPSITTPAHRGTGGAKTVPSVPSLRRLTVPNVVGTSVAQAKGELEGVGLRVIVRYVSGSGSPVGVVETQAPSGGSIVQVGSFIELRVSAGTRTTSTSPSSTPLGIFTDGSEGQPYYFISLFGSGGPVGSTTPRQVEGSLDFLYQDGQSSVAFTFDGSWTGMNLTVEPTTFPHAGSAAVNSSSVPQTIQATTVSDALGIIRLPDCTNYLRFATSTQQCEFVTGQTTIGDSGPRPSLGTYSDGATGTSHYVVTITTSIGDEVDGSIDYLDQDGRTTRAVSFLGLFQGSVAVITEQASNPGEPSISMLVADRELLLGECFDYLASINSDAQCTFDQVG